ncbi:MAG TPA: CpsB/CapC family capsule biosynthesis tyrosine phosphatase [Chloroflexota bacterium]|nr:CpsB/CapC family capsule biosynthesis tyrosine phosphatase [Chloroflexota bacterium]
MIDLHNHILPGADDGAADLAESLEIARVFVAEGVTRVVATPHLDPENDRGLSGSQVRERTDALGQALAAAGIPLQVLPGQEIYLTPEILSLLRSGRAIPLADSDAVLVELSLVSPERPAFLEDVLFGVQIAGYRPVLAHPERYAFVQRDPDSLEPLADRGIIMQLTAAPLAGQYGKRIQRTARRLLRRGVYSIASSDRHHPDQPRSLAAAYGQIAALTDQETADLLTRDNPAALLENSGIRRPGPIEPINASFLDRLFGR